MLQAIAFRAKPHNLGRGAEKPWRARQAEQESPFNNYALNKRRGLCEGMTEVDYILRISLYHRTNIRAATDS